MEKINLVELLKNCPKGMRLACTTWENVTFEKVIDDEIYIKRNNKTPSFDQIVVLNKYGCCTNHQDEKCRIFPKGKKSWEGFVPPCKFKKGDVLVSELGNIVLLSHIDSENIVHYHCIIPTYGSFRIEENTNVGVGRYYECVLANEQQRQRMYDSIKRSGYKYNQDTNKLEKSIKPKFKVDDKIVNNGYIVVITDIFTDDQVYGYKSKMGGIGGILFTEQDEWELVPDKFDVTTLKPYDKVLARCSSSEKWRIQFFEKFDKTCKFPFICMGYNKYNQCIPYEGNEHLLDTADSCSDYYLI